MVVSCNVLHFTAIFNFISSCGRHNRAKAAAKCTPTSRAKSPAVALTKLSPKKRKVSSSKGGNGTRDVFLPDDVDVEDRKSRTKKKIKREK